MPTPVSLDRLPSGSDAVIDSLDEPGSMEQRLRDLGFTPGSVVRSLFRSAAGDPSAFRIRQTVIALRREDSRHILVYPLNGAQEQ